jgi:hypothetical protein
MSPAFQSLRGAAPQVLILFLLKRYMKEIRVKGRKEWICTNKDCLYFTYVEAKSYGISAYRFLKAIDQLLATGFIKIEHSGGAQRHDKSRYSLSENWRIWTLGTVFEERPPDTRQIGYRNPKTKITLVS